jgi:hypothetical protein
MNGSFPWSFRMIMSSSSGESAVEQNWHGAIQAMFGSAPFIALVPDGTLWTYTSSSTLDSTFHQTTKTTTNTNVPGTATTSLPYHVASVVTWRTAFSAKYGRGRWYLPALSTGALATGGYAMSATAATDVAGAVNAAIAAWAGVLNPVLWHAKGSKTGPGPNSTDPIIGGDVPSGFDTQRRRADKLVPVRVALTF